jgi:hypothetical protein
MTAEVAVLNRIGVALAADSAVTIGQEAHKIYTSADKLFQLSPASPVGIMIYGNADFCGLPWETIIKTYRRTLGDLTFDTVDAHGEHFIQFLASAHDLFPPERQAYHIESFIFQHLLTIRDILADRLDDEAKERDGLSEEDLPDILSDEIATLLNNICSNDYLPGINVNDRERIQSLYKDMISEMIERVFGTLPFAEGTKESLKLIPHEILVRHFFALMDCGVVLAGFGETEYMPSMVCYEIEEIVADIPRAIKVNSYAIGDDYNAAIVPFAQHDMVESFMNGVHGELFEHAKNTTAKLFRGTLKQVVQLISSKDEEFASELNSTLDTGIDAMLERLFGEWKDRQQDYWGPVIEIAASLPKDELAAMAEALVNLTKFRRRVSAVRETVGGPIDVAVITKGDGFVWTQRKHYFDPQLNPRVVSRLQRGI